VIEVTEESILAYIRKMRNLTSAGSVVTLQRKQMRCGFHNLFFSDGVLGHYVHLPSSDAMKDAEPGYVVPGARWSTCLPGF
jgi:hypothetical protein